MGKGNLKAELAINSIVQSEETPRNDNFEKLYTQNDTPTDMVLILN